MLTYVLPVQKNFLNNEAGGVGYKPDADAILDNIFTQMAGTQASEMDGKMSNALRNILFGDSFQEDLCARNIFRGRELAMPSYAGIASCFGTTPDATVRFPIFIFSFLRTFGVTVSPQLLTDV